MRSFNKKIYPEKEHQISPYQEKAIRLWKLLLKDRESQLGVSTYGVRQIEKGNLLMVFQVANASSDDSVLTIMDVASAGNNLYELHISARNAGYVCEFFDAEMDRRMSNAENKRRSIIETDLDKLLRDQDQNLKAKSVIL